MLLTIIASSPVSFWSSGTLFGSALLVGLVAGLVLMLALSSQRWLLWYFSGAMVYWLSVEGIYHLLLNWLPLSEWHSYVAAMTISWLPLFGWVWYRVLRFGAVSDTIKDKRQQEWQRQRELAASRYVEHTPVYGDDFQPRFR